MQPYSSYISSRLFHVLSYFSKVVLPVRKEKNIQTLCQCNITNKGINFIQDF